MGGQIFYQCSKQATGECAGQFFGHTDYDLIAEAV